MNRPRRANGEQGVSLILALAFMALFGVIVSAVLVSTQGGLKTTPVVKTKDADLYAADGGIDYGIQSIRDSDELCQHAGEADIPVGDTNGDGVTDLTINEQAVDVKCTAISGDGTGGSGSGSGGPVWSGQYGGPAGWSAVATRYDTTKGANADPQWASTRARCDSPNTNVSTTTTTVTVPPATITVNDGQTYPKDPAANRKKVTSATAAFVATDVGLVITGTKGSVQVIPAGAKIAQVKSGTEIVLDREITPDSNFNLTGVTLTFTRPGGTQTITTTSTDPNGVVIKWCTDGPGGGGASSGQTVTFGGTQTFNAGAFSVPAASTNVHTTMSGVVHQYDTPPSNYCTRDKAAGLITAPQGWTCENPSATPVPDPMPSVVVPSGAAAPTRTATCSTSSRPAISDGVTYASPNQTKVTSLTANFTAADVGQPISGTKGTGKGSKIIDKATISAVISPTEITISKAATGAQTGVTLTIGATSTHTITYYYPGKYSPGNGNVPNFNGDYIYFASGVYYFEDVGYVPIGGNGAWGGALSNEQFVSPGGDCNAAMTDAAAKALCSGACLPADPGQGVNFIFGGASLFDIHAPITELNRRVAGDQEASCPGGKNNCGAVTIFAWASDSRPTSATSGQPVITGAYKTFNPGLSLDRCNCAFVTDKSGQQIIFHGLTYAPFSPVDVYSNAGGPGGLDYSPFFGGVVASEIVARVDSGSLGQSLFAGGFGPNNGPTMRTIRVMSTAGGVTSVAIIEIDPDSGSTTRVKSWRNQ
jgi:hypothetical protein